MTEPDPIEARGRDRRLVIILVIAGVVAISSLAVSAIGGRQAADRTGQVRDAAATAVVDPADIALSAYGTSGDPVAKALGVGPADISLRQLRGNDWCVTVDVSALLSSQQLLFVVDDAGSFTESSNCGN